ncbi:MAG: ribosome-binding factor A [Bacteroidetes bacterium]|nr:ribosome-binding factor A [Bacteroidota bacterium]
MDSTRQQKYARLIQKEIGEIFQRDGYNFYGKSFVTVMGAKVSGSERVASIYLSIFEAKDNQAVIDQIETHNKEIRKILGQSIRHQSENCSTGCDFLDSSLDEVDKIEKLCERKSREKMQKEKVRRVKQSKN